MAEILVMAMMEWGLQQAVFKSVWLPICVCRVKSVVDTWCVWVWQTSEDVSQYNVLSMLHQIVHRTDYQPPEPTSTSRPTSASLSGLIRCLLSDNKSRHAGMMWWDRQSRSRNLEQNNPTWPRLTWIDLLNNNNNNRQWSLQLKADQLRTSKNSG